MADSEDTRDAHGNTEEDLKIFETLCLSSPRQVSENET